MIDLGLPDLATDPAAVRVVKDEVVSVRFASAAGVLASAVGLNHYAPGDALITGSTGDAWCVSRDRFDPKYRPCDGTVHGQPGRYRNVPVPLYAKRVDYAFQIARRAGGDLLRGTAGDWAVQYAPGDYGLIEQTRFARVYRVLGAEADRR